MTPNEASHVPFSHELQTILTEADNLAGETSRRLSSCHILLALFTIPNQAQNFLREHNVDEETLLNSLGRIDDDHPGLLDLIVDRAERIAEGTRAQNVTSLHLLSALCGYKDSGGYRMMGQLGVNVAGLRTTVMGFLLNNDVPMRFRIKPGETRVRPDGAERNRRVPATIGFHPSLTAKRTRRPSTVVGTQIRAATAQPSPPAEPTLQSPQAVLASQIAESKDSEERARAVQADLARRLFGAKRQTDEKAKKRGGNPKRTKTKKAVRSQPIDPKAEAQRRLREKRLPKGKTQRKREIDRGLAFELSSDDFPTLCQYGRNLTAEAARGKIDPVIGRAREIDQLIDILNKRRANNPVLVGDPGVGKTAVVEGLARLIVSEEAPPGLEDRVLIEIEAGRILSGTGLRGSLSERMIGLKDEVAKAEGRIVVFLDEVHRWISGHADQSHDGAEELKPALARGTFPCIGATTFDEYRTSFENEPAFARRFQIVRVEEPSINDTIQILMGLRGNYEAHHQVAFSQEAIDASARLGHRYLPDRQNPDKALAVLDLAGSKARRRRLETVDPSIVAEVIGEMSGIPSEKLLMADRERFMQMEDHLMKLVVGHEGNLSRIAHVLRRNYAGFVTGRPIGSFLFLGSTGVGKTETAKVLADFLFHSRDAITALDMSEYAEAHSVARLIGSPPGYVGHETGGRLTDGVRTRPYQIVLFDEIEKAHAAVQNLLLQILEEGRLTDSRGRVADFRNTVVIMTSNLGASAATETRSSVGFSVAPAHSDRQERVIEAARGAIEPELWNRIDEPLVFEPLTRDQVVRIAHLKLQQSSRHLLDEKGIAYVAAPSVVDFLIDNGGFDIKLGARPLRRALERWVEGPIADLILGGAVVAPAQIQVDVEDGELVFDVN